MKVQQIIDEKGRDVATIQSESSIATAVSMLKMQGIGALVVSEDGNAVVGILSERDIVRGMVAHGRELLDLQVSELMTRDVKTCTLDSDATAVMGEMTRGHFRHLPVVEDGRLIGIISIGDVVKTRLGELETETSVLRDFIVGRS